MLYAKHYTSPSDRSPPVNYRSSNQRAVCLALLCLYVLVTACRLQGHSQDNRPPPVHGWLDCDLRGHSADLDRIWMILSVSSVSQQCGHAAI